MLLPSPTGRAGSAAAFSEEAFDVSLKDASAGGGGGGGEGAEPRLRAEGHLFNHYAAPTPREKKKKVSRR